LLLPLTTLTKARNGGEGEGDGVGAGQFGGGGEDGQEIQTEFHFNSLLYRRFFFVVDR